MFVLLYLTLKLVFGFDLCFHTHLLSNYTILQWRWWFCVYVSSLNRCPFTNSAYVVLLCFVLTSGSTDSSQYHSYYLSKYTYYHSGDRSTLSSSNPWKMAFTIHDQIVPFFLTILWVAVLLAESMVEAVRLDAHILEFENVVHRSNTVWGQYLTLMLMSKHTTISMRWARLSSLNVWHGVQSNFCEQTVHACWRVLELEVIIRVWGSMKS